MKQITLVSVAIICVCCCQGQWQLIPNPPGMEFVQNVDFITENTGFVLGSGTCSGDCPLVYLVCKTNDYGETWDLISQIPAGDDFEGVTVFNMDFVTEDIGFMSVRYHPEWNSVILKTIDGGMSWNQVSNFIPCPFHEIAFEDENVGYGASGQGDSNIMARTLDGGVNWDWEIISMMDLYVSDPGEVWMIHGQGIAHTVDYGSNWNIFMMDIDLPRQYWAIAKSGNTLMASGFGLVQGSGTFNVGTIAKRSIAESQWDVCDFPGTGDVPDFFLIDENNGLGVCTSAIQWPKSLIRTFDGGNTWHYQEYPIINGSNIHLNRVECPSPNVCYAKGYYNIIRTLNGGGPSIGLADYTVSTIEPVKPALSAELFPNPATDKLNISFSQALTQQAMLTVADITGREVARQSVAAGVSNVEMDVRAFPAGVYVVRVEGIEVDLVRRFVVE